MSNSGGGSSKLKRRQARLFSTLESVDRTDERASKRRRQSRLDSLERSRAAGDQSRLSGVLLELRILTQRCLAEEEECSGGGGGGGGGGGKREVREEVDALLENLLVARRELLGRELDGDDEESPSNDDDEEEDGDEDEDVAATKKNDVDYAKLIRQDKEKDDDETSSSDGDEASTASGTDSGDDGEDGDGERAGTKKKGGSSSSITLTGQLQSEYASLRERWKSVLNKHHSNLALHSGLSASNGGGGGGGGSKFQSRAVDVSFWEQVQGGVEHERFKQRTTSAGDATAGARFDDSKLYQQMLKDFISSSSSSQPGGAGKASSRADPAEEAAERLRRAVRKKSGADAGGDVDLAALLAGGRDGDGLLPSSLDAIGGKKKPSGASAVDRRASKGRKIRYTVHPKLVNFTFPVSRPEPMIKEDVWFKSLFGGVGSL